MYCKWDRPPPCEKGFYVEWGGRREPAGPPGPSYGTPHGRQRYGRAKRQELRAALVAFVTIGKCDDRTRAVMGDKAEEVRADCRNLRGLRSAGDTDPRECD
ncbi:MAG: hypothetical protein QOI13_2928 [Paraburkholderia sp.]|nr:hypothetical protein [Paraburkholderia sp.]